MPKSFSFLSQIRAIPRFVHTHVLSHPAARWIAGQFGWALIAGGIGLAQWDEYAVALLLFDFGSIVLFLKAYHWAGFSGWPKLSRILRGVFLVGAFIMIFGSYQVTLAKKADKPWSSIVSAWRNKVPPPLRPATPNPPIEAYNHTPEKPKQMSSPVVLRIKRFETEPMVVGEKLKLRLHIATAVLGPLTAAMVSRSTGVGMSDSYEVRRKFEDEQWKIMVKEGQQLSYQPTEIPHGIDDSWILVQTPQPLSQEDIDLLTAKTWTVYFMGAIRDSSGKTLVEYCVRTISKDSVELCYEHNKP